jgi:uncharacterized SAM-binding protein YcdF (DUF218 family)
MLIFLSKFLPLFIYPVGLITILLFMGCVLHRRIILSRVLFISALIILLVAGNRWFSYILARTLEWQYLPVTIIKPAEAIVVLGGGTESEWPPRQAVEVNSAGDRMIHAADLYHQGMAPFIILSGGNIAWMDSIENSPASDMRQIMLKLDVPDSALVLQTKSQNTREDALYSAELLKERGFTRVILVTSAMHMPRSVALFEKQGIEVIPSPTDFTITEDGWQRMFSPNIETVLTNILPNSSALGLTTSVMKEYIGMFTYWIQGWV